MVTYGVILGEDSISVSLLSNSSALQKQQGWNISNKIA